jgi:hypothetical protein
MKIHRGNWTRVSEQNEWVSEKSHSRECEFRRDSLLLLSTICVKELEYFSALFVRICQVQQKTQDQKLEAKK